MSSNASPSARNTKRAAPAAKPAKKAAKSSSTLPADHTPSEAVAHTVSAQRPDLAPSVRHIMTAELTEAERLHAINLFQAALPTPGHPHRDPRAAVEAARADVDSAAE